MDTKDFKHMIEERCHQVGACQGQYSRLLRADKYGEDTAFINILLRDNHGWRINNDIYTADDFLALDDQQLLLDSGFKTQINTPIDFVPEKVFGVTWKPYNEGSDGKTWKGTYMTQRQAIGYAKRTEGVRLPTERDLIDLSALKREWSIYQGQFGFLLDNRIFIPAGGYIPVGESIPYSVGNGGYYWASGVNGTYGRGVGFHSAWLDTGNSSYRAYGFQVRCLQE